MYKKIHKYSDRIKLNRFERIWDKEVQERKYVFLVLFNHA